MRHLGSLFLLIALAACGGRPHREYVWVQPNDDGFGLRGPITHTVRVRVDLASRHISWLDDLTDADGKKYREFDSLSSDQCQLFDEENWHCVASLDGKVVIIMKDGQLTKNYYNQHEVYAAKWLALGASF